MSWLAALTDVLFWATAAAGAAAIVAVVTHMVRNASILKETFARRPERAASAQEPAPPSVELEGVREVLLSELRRFETRMDGIRDELRDATDKSIAAAVAEIDRRANARNERAVTATDFSPPAVPRSAAPSWVQGPVDLMEDTYSRLWERTLRDSTPSYGGPLMAALTAVPLHPPLSVRFVSPTFDEPNHLELTRVFRALRRTRLDPVTLERILDAYRARLEEETRHRRPPTFSMDLDRENYWIW
jgi:hypothetical protein